MKGVGRHSRKEWTHLSLRAPDDYELTRQATTMASIHGCRLGPLTSSFATAAMRGVSLISPPGAMRAAPIRPEHEPSQIAAHRALGAAQLVRKLLQSRPLADIASAVVVPEILVAECLGALLAPFAERRGPSGSEAGPRLSELALAFDRHRSFALLLARPALELAGAGERYADGHRVPQSRVGGDLATHLFRAPRG